jgi:non-ribosomal peptide synthase protein (TIGR01720 family)
LSDNIDPELMAEALYTVVMHHDALRLNYNPQKHVLYYNNTAVKARLKVKTVFANKKDTQGYNGLPAAEWAAESFDLTADLLITAVIFKGNSTPDHLCLAAHHLVTDGVSWRILLNDLEACYENLRKGRHVALPPKTASLAYWQDSYNNWASAANIRAAFAEWQAIDNFHFALPGELAQADWRYKNAVNLSCSIPEEVTSLLKTEGRRIFRLDMETTIMLCFVLALKEWCGLDTFKLEVEHHGRDIEGIDVSATVGWFTSIFPVILQLGNGNLTSEIKSIKEQLKNLPDGGMGFGAYKKMVDGYTDDGGRMAEIRFNYLGEFDFGGKHKLFEYVKRDTKPDTDPDNLMTAKLELNALIVKGELLIDIAYNSTAYSTVSIELLLSLITGNVQKLADYFLGETEVHFTPSDFAAAKLSADEIDSLFA